MDSYQVSAVEAIKEGANVFLTGSAGTGKSYTISMIIQYAKENGKPFGCTATTGISALLIGGETINSYLGIGLANKPIKEYIKKNSKSISRKLCALELLIIDEVSMMNAQLLDFINEYLCTIRNNQLPFGGVQVLLCGDFCQLPPVSGSYCYEATSWKSADIKTIMLRTCHRQLDDKEFVDILQQLRFGECSKELFSKLNECKKTEFNEGIRPTILYSKNVDVDSINNEEYKKLIDKGNQKQSYPTMYSKVFGSKEYATKCHIPEIVELCVDSQVIITATYMLGGNIRIPNGARGVVKELFETEVLVHFTDGKEHLISYHKKDIDETKGMFIKYIPLKLAYALTIHKAQGMTIDSVAMDLGKSVFQYGQAYTALSRAKNLKSVKIIEIEQKSFRTHPSVIEFYKNSL